MKVLAWIEPATWPSVVSALKERPSGDELTLVAVASPDDVTPQGSWRGLMGRASRQQADRLGALAEDVADALLSRAVAALGRDCTSRVLTGGSERVLTSVADAADLLIIARDGDRSRLGPGSLSKATRFVVDHAPCTVELIWPDPAPGIETLPPDPSRSS